MEQNPEIQKFQKYKNKIQKYKDYLDRIKKQKVFQKLIKLIGMDLKIRFLEMIKKLFKKMVQVQKQRK